MKLSTIMIIFQAVLMLASVAATSFMMYNIKSEVNTKTGAQIFAVNSLIFYITVGMHGAALVLHGLSTFWCKGK